MNLKDDALVFFKITIGWTFTGNNGGVAISNYQIQQSTDNGQTWSLVSTVAATTTSFTVACTEGDRLSLKVASINGVGGAYGSLPIGKTMLTSPAVPILRQL